MKPDCLYPPIAPSTTQVLSSVLAYSEDLSHTANESRANSDIQYLQQYEFY